MMRFTNICKGNRKFFLPMILLILVLVLHNRLAQGNAKNAGGGEIISPPPIETENPNLIFGDPFPSQGSFVEEDGRDCAEPIQSQWYEYVYGAFFDAPDTIEVETYSVNKQEFFEHSIAIAYPQISSSVIDEETLKQINELLYSITVERFDISTFESPSPEIDIDYRIVNGDKLLSICFEGHIFDRGATQSFAYSINLDMDTGRQYSLTEFMDVDAIYEKIQQRELFPLSRLGDDPKFCSDDNYYSYGEFFRTMSTGSDAFFCSQDYFGVILPVSRSMGDYIFLIGPTEFIGQEEMTINDDKSEDEGTVSEDKGTVLLF